VTPIEIAIQEGHHMANKYTVERKIRVDAPASAIYERIVDFHRWPAWSPFEELDPAMDRTYAGAESGVGAVYEWSGNLKAGAGRMEIVDAVDDDRVVIDQRNRKPFRSESTTTFALHDSGDGTAVTWSITGPVTLVTRIMGIFKSMDRMVGPVFEWGLKRLKADAEAARPSPTGARGARDGGDDVVRGEARDQTDQESRSAVPSRT